MAVPKRKSSKARRDKRRSNVWKIGLPALSRCPRCKEFKLAHCVCESCGTYKGMTVFKV